MVINTTKFSGIFIQVEYRDNKTFHFLITSTGIEKYFNRYPSEEDINIFKDEVCNGRGIK